MAGASIEATLELWASSLRDVKSRIRPLFTQERVAASAGAFLDGLLSVSERLKRIVPHDIAQVIGFPPAADSVYGVGSLETALRRAGKAYVLGVAKNHGVTSWGKAKPIAGTAESVAQDLAASEWKRLSAGEGTKGPRLYDWAYVELADIDASEYDASRSGLWTRGLLIRRAIANQDLAFFSTWAPAGTSIEKLVRAEGCRWAKKIGF
jgi:SRSO17 transposase